MNFLLNPDFETDTNGNGLCDDWLSEWSVTSPAPAYTRVSAGVAHGTYAQRMQWDGTAAPSGSNKVEFYQATEIGSFAEGDPATFEVWLSGHVTGGGYAQIVIEGHTGSTYLDEVQRVVSLTANPQPFRITHPSLPAGTDSIVVVVMALELTDSSSVDVIADYASVTKDIQPAIDRRTNLCTNPSFEADAGTSTPTGWSTAHSGTVSVATAYPSGSAPYGSQALGLTLTSVASGTNNQAQWVSATAAPGTVAPGDDVTVSMSAVGSLTGCNLVLRLQFMTAEGGSAGTSDSTARPVTETAARISHTATAPVGTVAVRALIRVTGLGTADAFSLELDGVLLENASAEGAYFDGSMPGYEWTGTADASASRELIPLPDGDENATGTLDLSGPGSLAMSASLDVDGSAAYDGTGALSGTGSPATVGSSISAGAGSLTAVSTPAFTGALAMSGAGTLAVAEYTAPTFANLTLVAVMVDGRWSAAMDPNPWTGAVES